VSSVVLEAAAMTDVGLVRRLNQDVFASDISLGLFLVCDGMGGPAGGEIASALAAKTFVSIFQQEYGAVPRNGITTTDLAMERAAAAANRAVCTQAEYDTRFRGMGTTLIAARVSGTALTVLNVGDSRAYLLHAGELRQVSIDHSYLKEQVERGLITIEQARDSPLQSVITRAIGAEPDVHPDLFHESLEVGDAVLLSSDGLTRHVSDQEIRNVLQEAPGASSACEQLVELARDGGGSDNITCFVIRVTEAAA
jgi:serine/threonine protein phosphatase PrpC